MYYLMTQLMTCMFLNIGSVVISTLLTQSATTSILLGRYIHYITHSIFTVVKCSKNCRKLSYFSSLF
jgi:hypothetical protein